MKDNCIPLILLIVTLLTITRDVRADVDRCSWGKVLHDAFQARDVMVANMKAFKESPSLEIANALMLSLDELPEQIADLEKLDITEEPEERLVEVLVKQPEEPIVKNLLLFDKADLEKAYKERGLGAVVKTFQEYQSFLCIHSLYSPSSDSYTGHELPLDLMCHPIRNTLEKTPSPISPSDVCISVNRCSQSLAKACTGTKCNVNEAVPMMLSLLWYRASDLIARSLCYNQIPTSTLKSLIHTELQNIKSEVAVVKAYFSTLTWEMFFQRAENVGGFSKAETAMSLVTQHEKLFFSSIKACHDLDAQGVCIIEQIYAEYQVLKRMTKETQNPEQVRDLRRFQRVNHAKLVAIRKKALKEIETLAKILRTGTRTRNFVEKVSVYFKGLSRYDEKIAEQDVGYIKGKLDDFKTRVDQVSQELGDNIKSVLQTAIAGLSLDTFINIVKAVNPFDLFEGPGSNYEAAGKIAKKAMQIVKGSLALNKLSDVIHDTARLGTDFLENRKQIPSMGDIMKKIQEGDETDMAELSKQFITAYGSYDPKVDRYRLAQNDAMWGAFKDSACELLFEGVEDEAQFVTAWHAGKLTCENLEGTLAKFFTLRENIFDFQFELVDTIARVVRGGIGKTDVMKSSGYQFLSNKKELFLGFFKTQTRLRSEASTYCDKLEYMNQGEPIDACRQKKGLFSEADLDDLVAYNPEISYHLEERFVYIPTRPQFSGDQGFIDLRRLQAGSVTFRLPANATWLKQFNWLASDETKVPFVESFKLYLPRNSYPESYLKTQVTLSSKAGSKVSLSSDVSYDLPLQNTRYVTKYIDGFSRCPSGRIITNPYSLCENLPNICETTQRMPGTSMMPTILTTWELRYKMKSGASSTDYVWDAPDPTTNLLIIGKVKLRYLPNAALAKKNNVVTVKNQPSLGCCAQNMYRPKWNDIQCIPCPSKFPSVSKLQGYYCELEK